MVDNDKKTLVHGDQSGTSGPVTSQHPKPLGSPGWLRLMLAIIIVAGILGIWAAMLNASYRGNGTPILNQIASSDAFARGFFTFIVATSVMNFGLIMILAAIFMPSSEENSERFRRAREIFTAFIGILGTIVGFYFGATIGKTNDSNDNGKTGIEIQTKQPSEMFVLWDSGSAPGPQHTAAFSVCALKGCEVFFLSPAAVGFPVVRSDDRGASVASVKNHFSEAHA